jgi:cytochrome oxidase assembly protein ShyY1
VRRWRFALQRRWIGYLAMAIAFAIACFFLSRWQFDRNNETVVAKNLLNHNYAAAAVPLSKLLPSSTAFRADNEWREVAIDGSYEPGKQLLVRDRTYGSDPGFEVLTPFRLTDGSVFVIDRGWLPVGTKQDRPDVIPAPPRGLVHLTARLQGSETVIPGRVAPSGEIPEINLPTVSRMTDTSMYTGAYGLLIKETPAPPSRPVKAPRPVIDNGPFLSYAYQWILFALLGFFGLGWALRQEYRIQNVDDPVERARAAARAVRASRRPRTDAQIEDAQIAGVWVAEAPRVRAATGRSAASRATAVRADETAASPRDDIATPDVPTEDAPVEHPILHLN